MSNSLKTILSKLIGNNNTLSNNVLFIDYCGGNHSKAQFLSQIFYWSSRAKRKDGFFAKTYDEWHEEVRVKKRSIQRYSEEFQAQGMLETKVAKFNGFPTVHYKLDMDKLIQSLVTFCQHPSGQFDHNDMDTVTTTLDMDNLTTTSNRDYQRLHTETTSRESARKESNPNNQEKPDLTAEKEPSKKIPPKKVSAPSFKELAAKATEIAEAEIGCVVLGSGEEYFTPSSGVVKLPNTDPLNVGKEKANYYLNTERGQLEWRSMEMNNNVPAGVIDIEQICLKWAMYYQDKPSVLERWRITTLKMGNWISNEHKDMKAKKIANQQQQRDGKPNNRNNSTGPRTSDATVLRAAQLSRSRREARKKAAGL